MELMRSLYGLFVVVYSTYIVAHFGQLGCNVTKSASYFQNRFFSGHHACNLAGKLFMEITAFGGSDVPVDLLGCPPVTSLPDRRHWTRWTHWAFLAYWGTHISLPVWVLSTISGLLYMEDNASLPSSSAGFTENAMRPLSIASTRVEYASARSGLWVE